MSQAIGRRIWAIAEGYIPPASTGSTRELTSHETVCILNAGSEEARVEITIYFADRPPAGPYVFIIKGERTRHLRFNDFTSPEGHRLRQRDQVKRADRGAAHPARHPASGARFAQHHGLSGGVIPVAKFDGSERSDGCWSPAMLSRTSSVTGALTTTETAAHAARLFLGQNDRRKVSHRGVLAAYNGRANPAQTDTRFR